MKVENEIPIIYFNSKELKLGDDYNVYVRNFYHQGEDLIQLQICQKDSVVIRAKDLQAAITNACNT